MTEAKETVQVPGPGLLEIFYGVMFDPVRTFRRLAESPPLLLTLAVITLVNGAAAVMNILTFRAVGSAGLDPDISQLVAPMAPFLILAGFFLWYAKWLGYGAILHLTAQLLGGQGEARGTLVAYGLAGLPAVLMLPVDGLVVIANLHQSLASPVLGVARLAVYIWSVVLLVLGLREMHRFPAGRAVAVVLVPVGAVILLALLLLTVLASGFVTLLPAWPEFPPGF